MRAAVRQMLDGEVPDACAMCQYLPPNLFEQTLRDHAGPHACGARNGQAAPGSA